MEEVDHLVHERNIAQFDVEAMKIVWAGSRHAFEVSDRMSCLVASDLAFSKDNRATLSRKELFKNTLRKAAYAWKRIVELRVSERCHDILPNAVFETITVIYHARLTLTRKGCDLATILNTNVVREFILHQSCPSVDLGANFDVVFSSGGYTCSREENPFVEMDVGLEIDNDNLDALHVDTKISKEGCYPCLHDRDENPVAKNDVGLVIDCDNLDFVQLVTESCREGGYTLGGESPCAKKNVGLGIDSDNLDFLQVATGSCAQGPTGYGQGIPRDTEHGMEKIQTRGATSTFQDKPSNEHEAELVDTNVRRVSHPLLR